MKVIWFRNMLDAIKAAFVSRRVICSAPGAYPLWDKSKALLCDHLRQDIERYIGNGKYQTNWVTREYDPCHRCKSINCHNRGKAFHDQRRLTIEKAHRI